MLSDYETVEALEYGIKLLRENYHTNVAAMEKEIAAIQAGCHHDYKISKGDKEFYVCTKCKHEVSCRI